MSYYKKIELITRGDDCGSSRSANKAILEACRTGILRNVSFMLCCPFVEEAADLFRKEKDVCLGQHATLNAEWDNIRWGPVLPADKVPSLVDRDGFFLKTTQELHERRPPITEIMAELQAQLDKARKLGLDIRYVDAHMMFEWTVDGLASEVEKWADREGLLYHQRYYQYLPMIERTGDPVDTFIAQLQLAPPGQYIMITHPSYDNEEMRLAGAEYITGEQLAAERDWDRLIYTDPRSLHYCQDNGVRLLRYDEAQPIM